MYSEKECKFCGKSFTPNIHNQDFCCKSCNRMYYYRNKKTLEDNRICKFCGNKFSPKNSTNLYCSAECKKLNSIEFPTNMNKTCDNCGIKFNRTGKIRHKTIFCSRKCYSEYFIKNSTVIKKCELCGNDFSTTPDTHKQRFCSRACQGRWQSKTLIGENANGYEYKISDYGKIKMAESMVNRLTNGNLSLTDSLPQKVVNAILYKNGVDYTNEYNIKYFLIDNYIPDKNLFIEVMGDYWHCNPEKYPLIKNKAQKSNITRDKRKHSLVLNKYNCEILYIWEKDIYDNPDLCEKLMLEYINNNGILDDYNSFNYTIEDNELIFKDKIIQPYLSYDIDRLNSVCEYINSHN